ncbi:hypothetical protein ACH4KO_36765 [Streptomyces anulatus]
MATTPLVDQLRHCFTGGFAVELETSGDGRGEDGFAGRVTVAGVLPVGQNEHGVRDAVL